MALTVNVTKVNVKKVMDKLHNITLKLTCLDGEVVVINRNFTEDHRTGKPASYTANKFLLGMQEAIDAYKTEQSIFNSNALNNAIAALKNNLEG